VADSTEIAWAVADIRDRTTDITLYRDYYDGNHRMPWATPKWNSSFSHLFSRFRDNLCPAVVDAKADRIQLTGITAGVPARGAAPTPTDIAIQRIWQREKLEVRQGEVHKNALKDGDAFVIIWPDSLNQARWYIQRGDRVAARYSTEVQGELEIAAKLWPAEEWDTDAKTYWRLNLYYPDRIERYITKNEIAGGDVPSKPEMWDPFEPEDPESADDDEGAPSSEAIVANPYGIVPVFPFPNNADLGAYGRSELRDVIPLQDALNKSIANMIIGGEFVSWPQRYLIGVEVDVDEAGNPTGREQKQALDRIMAIGNPNAKAGTFEGADLAKFIAEQDSYRAEMARISRTPLHYLLMTGDFPSGEALGAAERPLMAQVDDRILTLRPQWQSAMSFSLTVENTVHEPAELNATFKDTRYKSSEALFAELTAKKDLGVPDEQLWREMGYDEEQVAEFADLKEQRAVAMQAAFDAGTPDTVNPEAEPAAPSFGG
jgi:hypothetical protein